MSVTTPSADNLRVTLFADGADLASLAQVATDPRIRGFTTNPTLMRKAGVDDYEAFARAAIEIAGDRPISFEVFSDDFASMEEQALTIARWGPQVFVKIPVSDTSGRPSTPVVRSLAAAGVKLNVTALTTVAQVERVAAELEPTVPAAVSLFAGRIADTGRDPIAPVRESVRALEGLPLAQLIWASPRELLNVFHADAAGCHIITMTPDLLAKLSLVGKDLDEFSRETVQMFHRDAEASGYAINVGAPKS